MTPQPGHVALVEVSPVSGVPGATTASFTVSFTSRVPGQGEIYFGSGPGCTGLVEVGTAGTSAGVVSVSCPTPTECLALGWAGHIATTTYGGVTWRVGLPTQPYPFAALACPSITVCYAVGEFCIQTT